MRRRGPGTHTATRFPPRHRTARTHSSHSCSRRGMLHSGVRHPVGTATGNSGCSASRCSAAGCRHWCRYNCYGGRHADGCHALLVETVFDLSQIYVAARNAQPRTVLPHRHSSRSRLQSRESRPAADGNHRCRVNGWRSWRNILRRPSRSNYRNCAICD